MKLLGILLLTIPFIMAAICGYKLYNKTYSVSSSIPTIVLGEIYFVICMIISLALGLFSALLSCFDGVDGGSVDMSSEFGLGIILFLIAIFSLGVSGMGIVSLVFAIRDKARERNMRVVRGIDNGEIDEDSN